MNEHRNASNQLTIDFDKIESNKYTKITKVVIKQFHLEAIDELTVGLDEKFQKFKNGTAIVGLEWDIWSGYIVNAKNTEAEPLVREIGAFINEQY